jgi:small conductance mechanosensitive channel
MYNQIATIVFYSIIFISISIILPTYGVRSETLLAILGTIGLGIGLSCQHVLSNLWCGIVITFNDIYKIDDVVKLQVKDVSPDSSGKYVIGQIKSFNLFYTKMADLSTGQEISVPNNLLYNSIGLTTNQSIVYS